MPTCTSIHKANADSCDKVKVLPAAVCKNCKSNEQTNFLHIKNPDGSGDEMPWMELKANAPAAAPAANAKAPASATPIDAAAKPEKGQTKRTM